MRPIEDIGHFIDGIIHPWTEGPRELLHHAAEHFKVGNDFDHRIAMISTDNAVELMMKTYLGLPELRADQGGHPDVTLNKRANHSPRS